MSRYLKLPDWKNPKLLFSIDDADLADVTDKDTANEIEMEGDTVTYGRFKTKIVATVKDTVLHGTSANLVGTVENALRSGLAQKEKNESICYYSLMQPIST